jgi:hypothetical protein
LLESNDELVWIGRRLQQLSRVSAASAEIETTEQPGQQLREVIEQLRQHLVRAATVLADVQSTRCPRPSGQHKSWQIRGRR